MDPAELRARVQELISDGFLPAALPRQTWGGPASGDTICAACGELIQAKEPEVESDCVDGVRRFYHATCSQIVESVREGTAPA